MTSSTARSLATRLRYAGDFSRGRNFSQEDAAIIREALLYLNQALTYAMPKHLEAWQTHFNAMDDIYAEFEEIVPEKRPCCESEPISTPAPCSLGAGVQSVVFDDFWGSAL